MTQAILLYILFVGSVALLLLTAVGAIFAAGWAFRRDGIAQRTAAHRLSGGRTAEGILTDVSAVPAEEGHETPLNYRLAVRFTGSDGADHRVLLGIPSAEKCGFAVGSPVTLRLLSAPVIEPAADALDPMRCADGKISGSIRFCSFMGKPVDETGTVMLESDYQAFLAESGEKQCRCARLSVRLFLAAGIAALFALSVFLNLFINE